MFFYDKEYLTIAEASKWATEYLDKDVTNSNISYLISYGKINKYTKDGKTLISKNELKNYYDSYYKEKKDIWTEKLGDDINWALSFNKVKESESTKHVHKLHPYKGKFIPQLVEYFLDSHTDDFKKEVYFNKNDIILDPFCGSGTTLVQCNELGMNSIGIDVSEFNALISNIKIAVYNIEKLEKELKDISNKFIKARDEKIKEFDKILSSELSAFNKVYFPTPEYKRQVSNKEIDEYIYGEAQSQKFLSIYNNLVKEYGIELMQNNNETFLDKWYIPCVRKEIEFMNDLIKDIKDIDIQNIAKVILSRTMRSCRATSHYDLTTLVEPVTQTYYCRKHKKLCKPIFSIQNRWNFYVKDTIKRIKEFDKIKTGTYQICLPGDSKRVNILNVLKKYNPEFVKIVRERKINGIFSSPPYIGMIDYHEQHAYAYELFGLKRFDELEIGSLSKGQGKEAREQYVKEIAEVLLNCKKYMKEDYNVFLVVNDKYNLYPKIAEKAGMKIINEYKRPVLNRAERNKGAYSEKIFHLKEI